MTILKNVLGEEKYQKNHKRKTKLKLTAKRTTTNSNNAVFFRWKVVLHQNIFMIVAKKLQFSFIAKEKSQMKMC